MFGDYFVDIETKKANGSVELKTTLFKDYDKALKFYNSNKKKDTKGRYTYSVAYRHF